MRWTSVLADRRRTLRSCARKSFQDDYAKEAKRQHSARVKNKDQKTKNMEDKSAPVMCPSASPSLPSQKPKCKPPPVSYV